MRFLRRHGALLGLILLAVTALYVRVSGAGFCGFDDFNESYRAAFFDGPVPSRIVTAYHFTNFMYRPVTSALQLATWDAFEHSALGFRARNLAMHLVSIALVYGIAILLLRSRAVAAAAAAAFGVNPYVNESVVVAIWTNTTAYALCLGSFFAFLWSLRAFDRGDRWFPSLVASYAFALVSLFTYEPTIVVFALTILYLAIVRFRTVPPHGYLTAFVAGMGLDVALFFGIRHVIGMESAPLLPVTQIVRNMVEYCIAVTLPVDPVLGNALFGIPLPVSGSARLSSLYAPLAGALVILCAFALGIARSAGARGLSAPWRTIAFCLVSIPASLVPIVFFREHVSEFNLYIPAALYAIALAGLVRYYVRDRAAFTTVLGLVVLFSAAGVWARNARVIACSRVASTILSQLPMRTWRSGAWNVRIATTPKATLTPPFGIYDYAGIQTIEVVTTLIKGAQEAVRLSTGNEQVNVDLVAAEALAHGCSRPKTCFYVSPGGDVKEVIDR